jgi:hypothetical protein
VPGDREGERIEMKKAPLLRRAALKILVDCRREEEEKIRKKNILPYNT